MVCKASVGILSDETIVKNHPWISDPEQELERIKREREEVGADPYQAVFLANRQRAPSAEGGESDGE